MPIDYDLPTPHTVNVLGNATEGEYAEYLKTLYNSHRISTSIKLYDADENYLKTLDHDLSSGQIDIDTTSNIERSCSVVLADVNNRLLFDNSGAEEAIYADRFIGIEYIVEVESINKDVVVPVFFGPVTRFERDGGQVTIEAMSKEALLQEPVVWGRYLKNAGLDNINTDIKYAHQLIKTILGTTGEPASNMHFGNFQNARLPKGFKLPRQPDNIWSVCKKIVQAVPGKTIWRIFYDGRGKVRVEDAYQGGYHFTDNPSNGVLLNNPQISYSLDAFRNTVVVNVNRQDGVIRHEVSTLPKTHPLSAHNLGRNGVPRYLVETIENDNIRKLSIAKDKADAYLDKLATETIEVSFDCLSIPHLQPGSKCRLVTNDVEYTFFADTFSLPLRAGDAMSVGFQKFMQPGPIKPVHVHWITRPPKKKHKSNG